MGKISQEQRNKYAAKVQEYKTSMDAILAKENTLQMLLKQQPNPQGAGIVRIRLAQEALALTSYQILINTVSVSLLGVKNEDSLADARKSVVKCLKYIEDIVTSWVDVPFSEYEDKLVALSDISYEDKYALLRKIGFAIREIENGYGANSKWKWSFTELWGKLAAVAKNSLDLKKAYQDQDITSPNRMIVMLYLALIKKLLQTTADQYREKYEVFSLKPDDFKQAILYLNALRRIHVIFGEKDEAEELKKKIEIWSTKLENDRKKQVDASKQK